MKFFKILVPRNLYVKFRSRNSSSDTTTKYVTNIGSTVDHKDVAFHGKLHNNWWDTNGYLGPLHAMNRLRVQFIRDGLANTGVIKNDITCFPLQGTKILDVGCGGGILSEPLGRIGAEVTGIDSSAELIELAKEHATLDISLSGKLNYVQTSIEHFEKENAEVFDAVVASEILEHVSDQQLFIKCCSNTLKPGGSLFITTLNKTFPSWFGAIIAAEHVFKLLPAGTHDWNKFISPEEVQRLVEMCGLRTKLIHGMFYNPLKNEWSWTSCTAVNYALHAIKCRDP